MWCCRRRTSTAVPDLKNLTRQKLVDHVVDIGDGEQVTIRFDRNAVTPAWVAEASARDEQQDPLSLPKALADVLVDWDITDDGAAFPPTAENVAVLGYGVQKVLLQEIMRAAVPGEAEGKASSGPGSTQSSVSEATPSLNGQATSPSPEPLGSLSRT